MHFCAVTVSAFKPVIRTGPQMRILYWECFLTGVFHNAEVNMFQREFKVALPYIYFSQTTQQAITIKSGSKKRQSNS